MKTKPKPFCKLDSIIEFLDSFNEIPSPTEGEEHLIKHVTVLANNNNIPVQTITRKPYLKVPPILVGNPDSAFILVTHCDRVTKDLKDKKVRPLSEISPSLIFNNLNGNYEGKLDNTVSLAVCLYLMFELKPKNTSLLITTAEELPLNVENPPAGNLHTKGGRGFISYLMDNTQKIKRRNFICIDVRPLDKGDVYIKPNDPMELGDGLVLRLEEHRSVNGIDRCIVKADDLLVDKIRDCAANNNVTLIDFHGPKGTTEIGRGWEMFLKPIPFPKRDYHVAWIQPPIMDYHTTNEKMSGNDIVSLCKIIHCLISTFENKSIGAIHPHKRTLI